MATESERLTRYVKGEEAIAPLDISNRDWPTLRRNNDRSAATPVEVVAAAQQRWRAEPDQEFSPTAPVSAGGLVFVGGSDGNLRALDGDNGEVGWSYSTNFPIKQAPTIWEGRLFFGSGDGSIYCLEAATGRQLRLRGSSLALRSAF